MPSRIGNMMSPYDKRVWKRHRLSNPYEFVRLNHILKFLEPSSGNLTLEVGCGGGTYTSFLISTQCLIAVDVSFDAIREIEQDFAETNNVFFVVCDAAHLPIRNMVVDRLACIDVLEHLDQPKKAIDEMSRVLCPHGRFLLLTACGENTFTLEHMLRPFLHALVKSIRSALGHVNVFTTTNIKGMLEQNFEIVDVEYMHHWIGWILKFILDITHLNSPQSHQLQPKSYSSIASRMIWLPLEAEYRLLKSRPLGTEIIIESLRKGG